MVAFSTGCQFLVSKQQTKQISRLQDDRVLLNLVRIADSLSFGLNSIIIEVFLKYDLINLLN